MEAGNHVLVRPASCQACNRGQYSTTEITGIQDNTPDRHDDLPAVNTGDRRQYSTTVMVTIQDNT